MGVAGWAGRWEWRKGGKSWSVQAVTTAEGVMFCLAWTLQCEFPVVYLKSVRKRKGIEQVSISHQLAWCLVSVNAPGSEVCLLLGLGSSVVSSQGPSEFYIRIDGPRQGHCGPQGVAASLGRCRRMDE